MSDRPIRTIAVVGDGIAGWTAAAALARRVPNVAVALIPVAGLAPSFADIMGGTTPSASDFHGDLKLDDTDIVVRTGGCFRLGTRFEGWSETPYIHDYGTTGIAIGSTPFSIAWSAARHEGRAAPFDRHAPAAMLGAGNRFVPAGALGEPMLSGYGHGLQLDAPAYRQFFAGFARHLGVRVTAARLAGAVVENGLIAALALDDGARLVSDLYVDATNASARLIGAVAKDWEDWSRWLRSDSVIHAIGSPLDPLPSLDACTAVEGGWRLRAALPGRTAHAMVYGAQALGDRRAARLLRAAAGADPGAPIRFGSGRRRQPWIGNVVAIGEAAVMLEPLEAVPLHILHSHVDRLVATLPDRDFAPVELDHYNRESGEEADRLRDMLILHYTTAARKEPFWRGMAAAPLPAPLAETLALFRERGRLPVRDRESFSPDSWLAVLLGQDILPRRSSIVAADVDVVHGSRIMDQYRVNLATVAAAAPTHRAYLASLARGSAA